jgi:lambda family phage portal protein
MEFKEWSPDHPANAFPAFIKSMLRFIAGALGVSYNALASDLEGVNYSSMRSGLLIERDQWKMIQSLVKENFLQPIFESWISMSLLAGALVLDTRDPSRFLDGKWQSRGWAWVDPLKDVQASILGVGSGLTSRGEIVSESGRDVEEVFEALAQEKQLAESLGLEFDISAQKPTVQKGPKDAVVAGDEEPDGPQAEVEETGKGTKSELQIVRRA